MENLISIYDKMSKQMKEIIIIDNDKILVKDVLTRITPTERGFCYERCYVNVNQRKRLCRKSIDDLYQACFQDYHENWYRKEVAQLGKKIEEKLKILFPNSTEIHVSTYTIYVYCNYEKYSVKYHFRYVNDELILKGVDFKGEYKLDDPIYKLLTNLKLDQNTI